MVGEGEEYVDYMLLHVGYSECYIVGERGTTTRQVGWCRKGVKGAAERANHHRMRVLESARAAPDSL